MLLLLLLLRFLLRLRFLLWLRILFLRRIRSRVLGGGIQVQERRQVFSDDLSHAFGTLLNKFLVPNDRRIGEFFDLLFSHPVLEELG